VIRRISCRELARRCGSSPAESSLARMNRSIGVRAHSAFLTGGSVTERSG